MKLVLDLFLSNFVVLDLFLSNFVAVIIYLVCSLYINAICYCVVIS